MRKIFAGFAVMVVGWFATDIGEVSAATGRLGSCQIWNYSTSAGSACYSSNTDPNYNGLQRVKVYCSIGGVHDTVRNGPWVLKGYSSYAACPYPDVRYFTEIQFL